MEPYPRRPRFFALKFIRLIAKMCAAQDVGSDAFTLLTIIASTEDARGYRSPVTFFNEQLFPMCGFSNVKTLDRARKRAVESGWLSYQSGGKGVAGKYFVLIPATYQTVDDGPSDEGFHPVCLVENDQESGREAGDNRQESGEITARKVGKKAGDNRQESGQHSSLPLPLPLPQEVAMPENLKTTAFAAAWSDWQTHRKEIRKKLTPTCAAGQIKKLAAMGERRAVIALRHSIEKGWTGIFEPSENGKPSHSEPTMTPEEIARRAEAQRKRLETIDQDDPR